jgi:hypothetical protein
LISLQDTEISRRKVIQRAHITRKKFSLDTPRLGDVHEIIKAIDESIDGMQSLLNPGSSYEKQRLPNQDPKEI